jgi:hypothetical protein
MAITFQRASGNTGTSHTIDIGNSGNNRLIIVIVGDESKSGDIFQGIVTIDGKTCTQALVANNPNGNGNHLEMHVIDEETLGSSNGSLLVSYSGGDTNWAIHVLVFYGVNSKTLVDSDKEDVIIDSQISVENISSNDGSLVVMAAGNGSSGEITNWTPPLIESTDGPNPFSAVLATAYGIETSGQTNKTYLVSIGTGSPNRSTGLVAVFNPVSIKQQTHQMML